MFVSVFEIFKIGIGPSSSHTMGPMIAARRFVETIRGHPAIRHVTVRLHGSLAFTGKGHGTDHAIALGLCGAEPETVRLEAIDAILAQLRETKSLSAVQLGHVGFDPERDLVFDYGPPLPGHPNGMIFCGLAADGTVLIERTCYSVGGGFVVADDELDRRNAQPASSQEEPYLFESAAAMLALGERHQLSIADIQRINESSLRPIGELDTGLDALWNAMNACIERGLARGGILPGGLAVKRRAAAIHEKLRAEQGGNTLQPHRITDWLSVYAMAVNEENAAGGRVVTAPTNGAAGVVPAVARYYLDHCIDARRERLRDFLLTAAAVGGIIKRKASISGAEVGCQGEVGSASAIAAAGLAAVLGGTNRQIENAAEIALEHHLGMTCDPIKGLVQVPCIERNALGAVKAVTAASLALRGEGTHFVSLDQCIETMRQTGLDMREKYKETSTGGLAVNVVEC